MAQARTQAKEHHIVSFLQREWASTSKESGRPLIVGFQGPQGSGKSYTCARVAEALAHASPPLRVVVFSLDDLYLPHDQLTAVALRYPTNPLLHGRGQPGTHDVDIGTKILQDFRDNASTIRIPVYDKSAHEGLGDRLPSWHVIEGAVDIVLFEGWCLGFHSVPMSVLQRTMEVAKDVTPAPAYAAYTLQDVSLINQELAVWEQAWYPLLDAFIQLYPITPPGTSPWSLVYAWRLEAEHTMKQRNGGHGMTDEQVKAFVQRYLPSYELFTLDLRSASSRWHGHGMRIEIQADRSAQAIEYT